MQRIERYGVIALVFLLVTIVAVSLWGERKKGDGLFSFLRRDGRSARVDELVADASIDPTLRTPGGATRSSQDALDRMIDLSPEPDFDDAPRAHGAPQVPIGSLEDDMFVGGGGPSGSIFPVPELPETIPEQRTTEPPDLPVADLPAASSPQTRSYTIRARDTLSEIAQRELGTSKRWKEIVALNPGLDPSRLVIGKTIRLPGAATRRAPESAFPARPKTVETPRLADAGAPSEGLPAVGTRYTVRAGDTLSQISERELGTSKRWKEIVSLNPGLDPAKLVVGRELALPAPSASAGSRERVALVTPPRGERGAGDDTGRRVR